MAGAPEIILALLNRRTVVLLAPLRCIQVRPNVLELAQYLRHQRDTFAVEPAEGQIGFSGPARLTCVLDGVFRVKSESLSRLGFTGAPVGPSIAEEEIDERLFRRGLLQPPTIPPIRQPITQLDFKRRPNECLEFIRPNRPQEGGTQQRLVQSRNGHVDDNGGGGLLIRSRNI